MQHTLPKSEITKAKILAAAEAEFSEKGYFGARVDEIAVAAGVNKRMIYQHYESKDGLYQAALLSVYGKLAECEARFCIDNLDKKFYCWYNIVIFNNVLRGKIYEL